MADTLQVGKDLSEVITINDNAGWCWYQDDRVIVDDATGTVLCATVANIDGARGECRNGDIDVTAYRMANGESASLGLSKILTDGRGDDHNGAALWQRPDGRYLAMYTGHNYGNGSHQGSAGVDTQPLSFYRISLRAHDALEWGPEQTYVWPSNDPVGHGINHVTYSNLLFLQAEGGEKGRLYNIARAAGQVMHIATSDDWGDSWQYRGVLSLPPAGGRAYSNGYFKFCSNGVDRIDFIATQAHPRDFNNGIYHGYIQAGRTFDASGNEIDSATFSSTAPPPEAFTPVFEVSSVEEDMHHHAWTTEIRRDCNSKLCVLFTTRFGLANRPELFVRGGQGDADHRLFFGQLHQGQWSIVELAKMGEGLHSVEEDYTGLGAIDPRQDGRVFVSTPIDPRDGRRLSHHEIFLAKREKKEDDWEWVPVTENSDADNLRPQLATFADGRAVLLWLRGIYGHQISYRQCLMAMHV